MCWNAESSLAGFVSTWAVCLYLLTIKGRLPWRYNAWTAGTMATVALIQLLEFFAWKRLHDPPNRRRVARLLRPTLLAQPAVNCALASYALGVPWLAWASVAYVALAVRALLAPNADADIRRGVKGHLAWTKHAPGGLEGWAYMLGLFVPLATCVFVGNATYGLVMMSTLAASFVFSMLAYPLAEASSMWCFWGLVLSGAGLSLNY